MKYKVGDKVRVKSGLVHGRKYGAILYWDDFKDKDFIVGEYDSEDNTYRCFYNMSEYWLSEEMLEPAYADGGYVPYHKIPTPSKPVLIADQLDSLADAWSRLGCTSFQMATDVINRALKKSEEKNLKFTFYVTEGTRVDKSCNGTIPTMTTIVETNNYSRTAPVGIATCDKADYDMRQGVLEALANMYCDGDFDKVYNKAVKRNELADKKKHTCKYCGKVFDTIEEREAEEAWHVERKKARRERYLLRKRAKEIAFEEQAQKMAKKMTEEDK